LPNDESDAAIARAIINLGQALNMKTIAEGVETIQQHEFLTSAGCGEFQGFLCTPALPPADLTKRYLVGQGYWQSPA
jgi:EAL domain-containing protein (putative c-di-GMP-specific phosphodiesterase class I)